MSIPRSIAIYEELKSIWTTMESDTSTAAILGMLRGSATNADELAWLGAIFDEDVIFVDWIQIPMMGGSGDLAMAVYQKGLLADVLRTDLNLKDVETWVLNNLDPAGDPYDCEDEEPHLPLIDRWDTNRLYKMDNLLKGLEHFTEPGQILVFCPTKSMNRIPLHALMLGNDVCICRNPVVYCQSLTLLRLCFVDRLILAEKGHLSDCQPVVIDPLNNDSQAIAGLPDISSSLGTDVAHLDPSSSTAFSHKGPSQEGNSDDHLNRKEAFSHLTKNASIIHFHGHVVFDPSNLMNHHLQLAPQPFSPEGDSLPLDPDSQLAVRDVFTLRFRPGTHVTTISRQSARMHVTAVDDHIGLATALHSSGAASLISSLWNIHADVGIRFSKLFYENLKREKERFLVEP